MVGATITVNNKRGEGDISGDRTSEEAKILKQIYAELQKMNNQSMVESRKAESSGLFGAAAGGSIFSRLLGAIGGAGAATVGGGLALGGALAGYANMNDSRTSGTGMPDSGIGLSKIIGEDGKEMFVEFDYKTKEIIGLLTKEEALRRGMIDELGEISSIYRLTKKDNEEIWGETDKMRDAYIVSNTLLDRIKTNLQDQASVDSDILDAKKRYLSAIEAAAKTMEDMSAGNFGNIGFGRAITTTYKGSVPSVFDGVDIETKNQYRKIDVNAELAAAYRNDVGLSYTDLFLGNFR